MPNAMTVQKVNAALTVEKLAAISADDAVVQRISEPGSLLEVAAAEAGLEEAEVEYLRAIPTVLQEAMRAAIVDAAAQGKAVQLQYSPGYDFEVRLWDFGQAVSIHISGPYPPEFPRDRYVPATTA